MGKLSMVLGLGVGYVVGTRAGRERFEQLKQTGTKLAGRPEVQQAKERIMTVAGDKLPINGSRGRSVTDDTEGTGQPLRPTPLDVNDRAPSDAF